MKPINFLLFILSSFAFEVAAQDFIYGGKIVGKSNGQALFAHCTETDSEGLCDEFEFHITSSNLPEEFYSSSKPLFKKRIKVGELNSLLLSTKKISAKAGESFYLTLSRRDIGKKIIIDNKTFQRIALLINYGIDLSPLMKTWHQRGYRYITLNFDVAPDFHLVGSLSRGNSSVACAFNLKVDVFSQPEPENYVVRICHPYVVTISWNFESIYVEDGPNEDYFSGYYH